MIQLKRIKSESVVQQIIDSLVDAMIRGLFWSTGDTPRRGDLCL